MAKKRRRITMQFKKRVALAALRERDFFCAGWGVEAFGAGGRLRTTPVLCLFHPAVAYGVQIAHIQDLAVLDIGHYFQGCCGVEPE